MRVLHVVPSFYPAHGYGGPITALYELCRAQRAAGMEVRVLTTDVDGAGGRLPGVAGRLCEDHGVPTWYARALPASPWLGRVGKTLEDLAPELLPLLWRGVGWADVVHVTAVFSPTSLLALPAAARRALVLSPRGSLLPWALAQGSGRKRTALAALAPLLRRVAGWHATSEEEAGTLPIVGAGAVVRVVENGVALPTQTPARTPWAGAAGAGPIITLLGRIDPVKGLDLALRAFAALRQRHPAAALVLAGPDRDGHGAALRALAAELGISAAVHFPGLVVGADKAALLAGSDALWLCSRMESFGNVVLEALAAGTPVVAVETTPWAWLAQQDLGAHCASTPAAVAAATEALLGRGRAPAFVQRARAAVAARFSWAAVAARMGGLYEDALSARRAG